MIYISDSIYTNQVVAGVNPNAPLLCFQNYVSATNTSLQPGKSGTFIENLANPSTAFYAQINETDEFYIEVETDGQFVDYVGVARHNLQPGAEIRVSIVVGGVEFNSTDWQAVGSSQAILKTFQSATPDLVRVKFRGQGEFVRIGVLYVGLSTRLQRNIYVGHTPITYGRNRQTVGGISEAGQYLGEVVRRRTLSTSIDLQNLTADWYRDVLDRWLGQQERTPAFFAWRPFKYPSEVAYVWATGDPRPTNQRSNGMMSIQINLEGLA
jgi:hypothetical protein